LIAGQFSREQYMIFRRASFIAVASSVFVFAACSDAPTPNDPSARNLSTSAERSQVAQDRLAALFPDVSSEIMAMPGTVYADNDEAQNKLVFGVESENAIPGITRSLLARGLNADEFVVKVTEPIKQLATLQSEFRPTINGIQINFPGYLCTMGFNVDHAGGRSFITNSHCTTNQGGVDNTPYYQPLSSVNSNVIAVEVADPNYQAGIPGCSAGKVCRKSDSSRELYNAGTASTRGVIAKTTGVNTGSLTLAASNFTITEQDNTNTTFSGTVNKVGRTTGWTAGPVTATCVTVNVSGSNIQQQCQTLVTNNSANIVGAGDSGSPVFQITSGDNVKLIGILWGGGGSTQFVFSPLKNIQDELGAVTATFDGSGGGGGGEPPPPPPCVPRGNSGK
jgi:hypothetical protein